MMMFAMFDRFTDEARKSMALARQEASRLLHDYIGTEHVLLGLIRIEAMSESMAKLGTETSAVRDEVERRIVRGKKDLKLGQLPFTPRMKKALELAMEEAHQLGHDSIGVEHVLLGLIREGDGIAGQVLRSMGADIEKVRRIAAEGYERDGSWRREGPRRPWWKFW